MHAVDIMQDLNHAQRERLTYIDFRLYFMGEVGRPDLLHRFGIAAAAATRDFALYRQIAPHNAEFDGSSKTYRTGKQFSPIFEHAQPHVLSALIHGLANDAGSSSQTALPCETPTALSSPRLDILAPLCRAIRNKRSVRITYYSMSSGPTQRVIVPFALIDTGTRWHVRAFDRKSNEFRDFVMTRIQSPTLMDEVPQTHERPDQDVQWTRIVELDVMPHPRLARPEIVRMDYAMETGSMRIRVRAAVAGYMLLRWGVDCSPDHSLIDEQYRLCLTDPLALYGVENASLAPGYQTPAHNTPRQ